MYNPQNSEKEILAFWEKNKIFDKLRKKNKGKKKWSFIDGPITANNPMGVHHAWGRTYKDVFQRFKAMQGYEQRFQNGFDCQGLWVEREEEKELGLKNKKDIEKFGILKFVQSCKKRVEKYSEIQKNQSIRLGQWMDWVNSYYTMSDTNNEHNWMLLKCYYNKGMLYKGKDVVPWCWRCGTASSKHDIVTEGYKEVTHTALFMQFPLKEDPDTYLLIFTTTPWTVPANVSVAVNPAIEYALVENDGHKYWIAASRVGELVGEQRVLKEKTGSELVGLEYVMPYADLEVQKESPHAVVGWDIASEEEGTGIVHIAPGCGSEDFNLSKKIGLPTISPLDESGTYREGFGEFSGKFYSEVTKQVLHDLKQRKFVYKTKQYRHRYPHCWRCGQELVFRLVDEWYIKCTKEVRATLSSENKKITWFPEYGKIRQETWFNNMGDWLISRKRYWGLPLPIWECSCGNIEVIGSREELGEKAIDKKKVDALPELHRPWIDEIKIKCEKCKKEVSRVLDVGDAWLDAGIVPFSTLNYMGDKNYWKEWFPADFICENMPGQYRGWFNALFWAAAVLTGKAPTTSILGYETVNDEKGEEMHKSKGNTIWFDEAVEKVGADPMRLLYCLQDPAQELRFGYTVLKEHRNNLLILYNLNKLIENCKVVSSKKIEDLWIISKAHSLVKKVSDELESLRPHQAMRTIQNFWLNDLSRGYVQFVRDRLSEGDVEAQSTLREAYVLTIKVAAPFVPFIAESIWQELKERKIVDETSIHLTEFPKAAQKKINEVLETEFDVALKIIEKGLAERDKAKISLRWPLATATIHGVTIERKLQEIIARQLNVKQVIVGKGKETAVELDTMMTPELEAEGFAREVTRKIQAERKQKGLQKGDLIDVTVFCDQTMQTMLAGHQKTIEEKTNSKRIIFTFDKFPSGGIVFTVRERKIGISFS